MNSSYIDLNKLNVNGVFYIFVGIHKKIDQKILSFNIISDFTLKYGIDYDEVYNYIAKEYTNYNIYTNRLIIIPIKYVKNSINNVINTLSTICLSSNLLQITKNMYTDTSNINELKYMFTIYQILKIIGLDDIKTITLLQKYILSNCKTNDGYVYKTQQNYVENTLNMFKKYVKDNCNILLENICMQYNLLNYISYDTIVKVNMFKIISNPTHTMYTIC